MSVLAVDAGTSVVKALVLDDEWQPVAVAAEDMAVHRPYPGWAEQDPDAVWRRVVAVSRRAVAHAVEDGVEPPALVAVTAQGDGCWLVDAEARPVRNALLWNDSRAAQVVQRWDDDGLLLRAFRRTGSYGFAGLAHAQLTWLNQHEPDVTAVAHRLLSCGSVLYARMTGRQVLDVSEASNPFLAADGSGYDDELLAMLGLSWARRLLPEVVREGERAASLTPAAAHELGLAGPAIAVLAPYDVATTAVGLGATTARCAMAVLGTTLAIGVGSPDAAAERPPSGSALDLGLQGRWMLLYATLAGTEVLEWGRRLLGLPDVPALVALAGRSSGARPLVLPYLSPGGERTPFRDPLARGVLAGLTLASEPADVARGLLEGLTLTLAECLAAADRPVDRLLLSGGGARSRLWCQLVADATGVPVERGLAEQAGALGAAIVARTETTGRGLDEVSAAAVRPGPRYEPTPAENQRLVEGLERLRDARQAGLHRI